MQSDNVFENEEFLERHLDGKFKNILSLQILIFSPIFAAKGVKESLTFAVL